MYNTALATVAGAGKLTCDPAHPCKPAERCPTAGPQDAVDTFAARAERLGVGAKTYREARALGCTTPKLLHTTAAGFTGRVVVLN